MMRTIVALSLSLSLSSAATAPAMRPALKLRGGFAGVDANTAATVLYIICPSQIWIELAINRRSLS